MCIYINKHIHRCSMLNDITAFHPWTHTPSYPSDATGTCLGRRPACFPYSPHPMRHSYLERASYAEGLEMQNTYTYSTGIQNHDNVHVLQFPAGFCTFNCPLSCLTRLMCSCAACLMCRFLYVISLCYVGN